MIRIYKNNDMQIVTKGAFESIFKPLGYKQVIEVKEVKEEKKSKNEDKDNAKKSNTIKDKKLEKEV